jgi:DNA-binding SARP family transcriptional activator
MQREQAMTDSHPQEAPADSQRGHTDTMLRISLFGPLALEWVGDDGTLSPLPQERFAGRGAAPALGLLKALLCCPNRFATRDWLMEQFWPDTPQSKAEERLNDVASGLRTLLRPAGSQAKILHYVHGTSSSGYRLEDYPMIWVDADAFRWYVEQAARFDRFGQDALSLWEHAYQLASRGPFLLEERYSEWASARREDLAGQYRQCVHRLAALLRERGATEQAILYLRAYWQTHPTDEDALRPLMELLGEQERFQEAEEYYQQLLVVLAQEDMERQPVAQTQDLREFLRAKQIQRRKREHITQVFPPSSLLETTGLATAPYHEMHPHFSHVHTQDILPVTQRLEEQQPIMNRLRRTTIEGLLRLAGVTAVPQEWWERFTSPDPSLLTEEAFATFQQLLEDGWGLCNAGEWEMTELVLKHFLPSALRKASQHQEARLLAAQGLVLRSILEAHRLKLALMLPLCQQAVAYAKEAGEHTTLCMSLNGLAVAYKYNQRFDDSLQSYISALPYCDEHASPLVRSRIFAGLAAAYARQKRQQEAALYLTLAYEHFPAAPEADPHFLSADHGLYMIAYYEGLMYIALNQPQKAVDAFEHLKQQLPIAAVPQRNYLEMLNQTGRAAILSHDLDYYASCLKEGLRGALELKSQKRLDEAIRIFREEAPQSWQTTPQIREVVECYPLLLEAR